MPNDELVPLPFLSGPTGDHLKHRQQPVCRSAADGGTLFASVEADVWLRSRQGRRGSSRARAVSNDRVREEQTAPPLPPPSHQSSLGWLPWRVWKVWIFLLAVWGRVHASKRTMLLWQLQIWLL